MKRRKRKAESTNGATSPARKGGRGLKPKWRNRIPYFLYIARPQGRAWIETFKREVLNGEHHIARPQGRAWIETIILRPRQTSTFSSPARKGGRGLKQRRGKRPHELPPIARPQGRAWIETSMVPSGRRQLTASPARKGGRGLKQEGAARAICAQDIARPQGRAWIETSSRTRPPLAKRSSPARKGGRGLKQLCSQTRPGR